MSAQNPRHLAVRTASERVPRKFELPTGPDGETLAAHEYFGINTFSIAQMRKHLPAEVVRSFQETTEGGGKLDPTLAERIASAVLEWAQKRGVSHFCHWFHPMTGSTAEKHDAFLTFDDARPISKFTGYQLIQSEPDASSFPSGGMRTTFEARGYTAWDPTSPMFIVETVNGATLCIPSCFISYHGDALDKKTPLLRSMEAINTQATRLCGLLGDEGVTRIIQTAGTEQEYFLIDKAYTAFRPDLTIAGRTVLGAAAPKGQNLDDHYFGSIATRALACMHEVECELYKLGVPAKTRHNEVAPSQYEIAVLYGEANVAADHNQILMETLRKVADRHGFCALMHEKPFAGINGSGKHLNWSLQDNLGHNLLEPGDTPSQNLRFLAFLASTILGVYRHASVLRASIASHGNDFRLGANEAPPAIISVFLGEQLTRICNALEKGTELGGSPEALMIELGVNRLPEIARDTTDRNRTSPFAFTGNKFEFRAVGSNSSVSFPLSVVNLIVADGIDELCRSIQENGGGEDAVLAAIRTAIQASSAVRFEGNNYSDEWVADAARRGLPNLKKTPEALEVLRAEETTALFTRHKVYTPAELSSHYHVKLERYILTQEIEIDVIRNLIDQSVIPAAIAERTTLANDILATKAVLGTLTEQDQARLAGLNNRIGALNDARTDLDELVNRAGALEEEEKAALYAEEIGPCMERIRVASDAIEARVSDQNWALPRYSEMLFQN